MRGQRGQEKTVTLQIMVEEFATARCYSGTRVGRSRRVGLDDVESALGQALVKGLKGTTGRRIISGVLGGCFKGR